MGQIEVLTRRNYSELSKDEKRLLGELKTEKAWLEQAIIRRREVAEIVRKNSHLGRRFQERTFENYQQDKNQKAYDMCYAYAENFAGATFNNGKNSLMLFGSYGTGKTHLAAAIANYVIDVFGMPVMFDTWVGHLNELKAEFDGGKKEYADKMKSVPLLIIDDFGKEKPTEWNKEVLFDVINARYERYLPVIITTNLTWNEVEKHIDDAVQSRLIEICDSIQMSGEDMREQ